MKTARLIKQLSLAIVCVYFASMVAGPAYGWKGVSNGVEYEIVISQLGVTEVMTKNSRYLIQVICQNEGVSVPELNISLPGGFELVKQYDAEKQAWWNNWTHNYAVKSPQKAGTYRIAFSGKDAQSRGFNFEAPIIIVEDYGTYKVDEAIKNSPPSAFLIIGGLIVVLGFVGQFIFK